MSPPSTVGRHALSTRFTARVRVAYVSTPDRDSLQAIFTQMISKVRCGRAAELVRERWCSRRGAKP